MLGYSGTIVSVQGTLKSLVLTVNLVKTFQADRQCGDGTFEVFCDAGVAVFSVQTV